MKAQAKLTRALLRLIRLEPWMEKRNPQHTSWHNLPLRKHLADEKHWLPKYCSTTRFAKAVEYIYNDRPSTVIINKVARCQPRSYNSHDIMAMSNVCESSPSLCNVLSMRWQSGHTERGNSKDAPVRIRVIDDEPRFSAPRWMELHPNGRWAPVVQ